MILAAFFLMFIFCFSVGLLHSEDLWTAYKPAIIAGWIFFAIALIFAVPILALICLHIYLKSKGLTTFQFIMGRREQQKAEIEG